jgi:thiol peroxidase
MSSRESWKKAVRSAACVGFGAWLAVSAAVVAASVEAGESPSDVAAKTQVETSGFLFKQIPVDEGSARAGAGQSVLLRGQAISLEGREIRVGDSLRAATLQDVSTQGVAITGGTGRVRIVSVVPALQTPTCEQQTHYLSEKSGDLSEQVELVTISLDPPELQKQFAAEAEIENVTFLSDAAGASFGRAHGLLIEKPRMLTRAVLVVDADDVVRYLQVVPDVSHMPDMEAAFEVARRLVEAGG